MPNQDHQRRTTYISRKDDTYYLDRLLDTFGWTLDSQMRPDAQLLSKSTLGNKIANDAFLESQALKHSIFNDLIPQNKPYETQLSELISLIKEMNLSKIEINIPITGITFVEWHKINHALNKILEHCPQIKKVGLNSKNWEVILRLIFHWRCSGTNVRELYLPSFKGWDKVFDDLLNHISKTFLRRIEFTSRHYPDYAGSEYENDRIEKLNAVLKANAEKNATTIESNKSLDRESERKKGLNYYLKKRAGESGFEAYLEGLFDSYGCSKRTTRNSMKAASRAAIKTLAAELSARAAAEPETKIHIEPIMIDVFPPMPKPPVDVPKPTPPQPKPPVPQPTPGTIEPITAKPKPVSKTISKVMEKYLKTGSFLGGLAGIIIGNISFITGLVGFGVGSIMGALFGKVHEKCTNSTNISKTAIEAQNKGLFMNFKHSCQTNGNIIDAVGDNCGLKATIRPK